MDESTLDVLARTLWGEARGEGSRGMAAVASVVMNRVARPGWWGVNIKSCCLAQYQFSCWLENDPNLSKLKAVTLSDKQFALAYGIAAVAMDGNLVDRTNGADSYYAIGSSKPNWAIHKTPCATIGKHEFYKVG